MRSGIDLAAMDAAIRPQDDLFGHVNAAWIAATPGPQDRGRYGTFDILRERAEADMRALLEEDPAEGPGDDAAGPGALSRTLYAAFLDQVRADAAALEPIAPLLAQADAVADGRAAMILLGACLLYTSRCV